MTTELISYKELLAENQRLKKCLQKAYWQFVDTDWNDASITIVEEVEKWGILDPDNRPDEDEDEE